MPTFYGAKTSYFKTILWHWKIRALLLKILTLKTKRYLRTLNDFLLSINLFLYNTKTKCECETNKESL